MNAANDPEKGAASEHVSSEHVYGVADTDTSVIHYGDYLCGESLRLHHALKRVVDDGGYQIKYAFRYRPLRRIRTTSSSGPEVHDRAIAAEAAAIQDKFWPMHEALYRFANEPDAVSKAAEAAELDLDQFASDLDDPALRDRIEQQIKEVSNDNVDRVPTLLIEGDEYLGPWDPESLQEAIRPPVARQIKKVAEKFAEWAAASGAILIAFALIALCWVNSSFGEAYHSFWHSEAGFVFAGQSLMMSLHHWVNDLLMAVFFLVVGLELKRELLSGELSDPRRAVVPVAAAFGGMLVPALLYAAFNLGSPSSRGWGVPMATDIAFTLGVLALLGSRVSTSLIVFVTALAVVDDLGAILVLAVFYNHGIVWEALGVATLLIGLLVAFNRARVYVLWPYLTVGLLLWTAVYFSGLHATLAGVLLAITIPTRSKAPLRTLLVQEAAVARGSRQLLNQEQTSEAVERKRLAKRAHAIEHRLNPPADRMEKVLQPWSSFFVLPLFALANAGIVISTQSLLSLDRISVGIIAGLVIGKPLGIVLATWMVDKSGLGQMPSDSTWSDIIAVGFLCGIGFTMSIFISTEAFSSEQTIDSAKLAVMIASLLSAFGGVLWLTVLPRGRRNFNAEESTEG